MILDTQEKLATKHVYVIGLSAGCAMASAALVNYPDLFQGGAVIAGLPILVPIILSKRYLV